MMNLNDANQSSQNVEDRNEGEKLEQKSDSNNFSGEISKEVNSGGISDGKTIEQESASNNNSEKISNKLDSESIAIDENLEQEPALNNAREHISDKIDSESIAGDEKTRSLRRQQNGYFENETESYEIIENICQSFNDFQKTIVDFDKATFSNNAFYDHTSMIENSPTSCTSGNLLPNFSEPKIIPTRASPTMESLSSESTIILKCEKLPPISNAGFYKQEMHCDVFKKDVDWDIYQPGLETNHNTESLPESRFSFERLKNENAENFSKINSIRSVDYVSCQRKPINQPFNITETNERDVEEIEIISTGASPTMESLTSGSRIIPKCKKLPPISNARVYKRKMHCDVFKEDDDWDIYEPGFVMTRTESLQESRFSFQRLMTINAEYLAKNESKCSDDYISCQRILPYIEQGIRCSPSNKFHNYGRTLQESTEERMLQEVKEFFLHYPMNIRADLSDEKRKMEIIISPYYSNKFALRHGLPLPTFSPVLKIQLPKNRAKLPRLFEGYELIQNTGVSEDGFFDYIYIDNKRPVDSNPWLFKSNELNPATIRELDCIQEQVGDDIFNMIYGQLKTDENYRALFRDEDLLTCAILFYCGEQPTDIEYEVYNIPDVVSEDIRFFQTNAEFSSTTSRSHVNKTPGLTDFESNSYADNEILDDIFVSRTNMDFQSTTSRSHTLKSPGLNDLDPNSCANDGKNSRYSEDIHKVQPVSQTDFLEIKLECSSTMQSTNQDHNENPSSIDLFQGHSDKSNSSPNPASFMSPSIQNSFYQNDEEIPRKVCLVTPNNATHSSDQYLTRKSRNDQPEKSFEVLENVSKAHPRVRKYISQGDDVNSSKKIRLQGNPNFGQAEPYKEEPQRKEESRTPSQDSWPIKPRKKSCIVM